MLNVRENTSQIVTKMCKLFTDEGFHRRPKCLKQIFMTIYTNIEHEMILHGLRV